jgi:hypothetical protein
MEKTEKILKILRNTNLSIDKESLKKITLLIYLGQLFPSRRRKSRAPSLFISRTARDPRGGKLTI